MMTLQVEKKEKTRPRRPFSVTLVILGVLTIAGINLIRLVQTIQSWSFLAQLQGVSPFYMAASGLFWSLLSLLLVVLLWRGMRLTYSLLPPAAVLYLLYDWLDSSLVGGRLDLASNSSTWPFKAGLSLFVLVFLFWTFSRLTVRTYFGRNP